MAATVIEAVAIDPGRRDREVVLGRAMHAAFAIDWDKVADPETRRRVAYLVDVAQHLRGQTREEAQQLDQLRRSLPVRAVRSFWPGERPLPPGTDPIAERWGFCRGVDPLRLRAAMTGSPELLPAASGGGAIERA